MIINYFPKYVAMAAIALAMLLIPSADAAEPGHKSKPDILPLACETAIALSAAPDYLRKEATVLALVHDGYKTTQTGSNPFTCIVNRDHPRVLKPTCFDKEGSETVIPKIIYTGKRLLKGDSMSDINRDIDRLFEEEVFQSQRRPGVAYMLSRYNRPFNPRNGKLGFFPPHVMFHAPNLSNEDIGHDMNHFDMNRPLPMIAYGGRQGYMIMIADDGAERQRSDLHPSCPDWVYEE